MRCQSCYRKFKDILSLFILSANNFHTSALCLVSIPIMRISSTQKESTPPYINAPWKGYFTMILVEAMEESRNSRATGKSCKIEPTSMNRWESSELLTWEAAFSLAFSSLPISSVYLLVCLLGLLNLEWVHKEEPPPPVESESTQEGHGGCVSPSGNLGVF